MKKFTLIILFLLFTFRVDAATQLLKTVMPSGGDYTSLEACMNANEQNLVTADQYFDVEIDGSWTSADTTAVTIHNYTTDATRYINIYTTAAARHNGKEQAVSGLNNYRLIITDAPATTAGILISVANVRIEGLEVSIYDADTEYRNYYGINSSGSALYVPKITYCIIHDIFCLNNTSNGVGIWHARQATIYNNIIYNVMTNGIWEIGGFGQNQLVYNNTVYNYNLRNNSSSGISTLSTNANNQYKNNLVIAGANGGNCYSLGVGVTTATNGGSDTTGEIDNLTTSEFISVTAGSEDLHLATEATSIDAGTDLSATFTDDIDGVTRTGTWDIGADEFVSAAARRFFIFD